MEPEWVRVHYTSEFAPAMGMNTKGSEVNRCNEGISRPEIQKSVLIERVVLPSVYGVLAPFLDPGVQSIEGGPLQAWGLPRRHIHTRPERIEWFVLRPCTKTSRWTEGPSREQ